MRDAEISDSGDMTPYHVGVAAEAFAAALFARAGFHVSVQYGANQPGYDLVIEKGKRSFLVSVKGSQDGAWGLTQGYLRDANYQRSIDAWLERHGDKMIFCFVQFKGKAMEELPDVYVATAAEVAAHLKSSGRGLGGTVLHVCKTWKTGKRAGCTDTIPTHWQFSKERIVELFSANGPRRRDGGGTIMTEKDIVETLLRLGFDFWRRPGFSAKVTIGAHSHSIGVSQHLAHPNFSDGSVYVHTCTTLPGAPGVLVATGPELKPALQSRRNSNAAVSGRREGAREYPAWIDVEGDPAASELLEAIRRRPL